MMPFEAGSAKADITPQTPALLVGYGSRERLHTEVHDPLSLHALYIRGETGDAMLISVDLIFFAWDSLGRILPILEAELGLPPSNVLICATHTHSGPSILGEGVNHEWRAMLEKQVVAVAALAKTRLRQVTLRFGRSACEIGINRREMTPSGEVILGDNPEGAIDRELIVLAVDDTEGRPVARVCNFACHGVVLGWTNRVLSGDWPGIAGIKIEENLAGGTCLFLNGGAGNINPRIRRQSDFEVVEQLADEFCTSFREACDRLDPISADSSIRGSVLKIHLPRKIRDVEDGKGKTRPLFIHGLRLGPLCVVGFPGEVFSETAMAVKEASPHPHTMVTSYAFGPTGGFLNEKESQGSYVPIAQAYEEGGYEVRVSLYAEGAETILREGMQELLERL